ncbi:glycosyltransferase family 4 protein [Rufibacter sp. XAAS-G3-1]|uniref:glycosyltransferase family 4 protein n=1 Tax=Rufibacter sp. XAAS-G3-1 TaxID=2729134 RepID=UPI0015E7B583|nr:glycosyltransferase family 4 protein [Rufibacter sp. XAAS-G3-1]
MKVLLISDTLHAGGAETFVLRLATKLKEFGIAAEILSLNPDVEDKALISRFPNVIIHRVFIKGLRWIKRLDRLLRIVGIDFSLQYQLTKKQILEKHLHYDVYHTHLFPVDLLLSKIKELYPKIVLISTLHGDYNEFEELWQNSKAHKKLNWPVKVNLLKEKIDAWVYISQQQYELFSKGYLLPDYKLVQIYNGYESDIMPLSRQRVHGKNELTFIMVARGIQPKGWEYLIKAFNRLPGNHKLVLVGKGDFLENLSNVYSENRRIEFIGFHPNPVELINEADVFVFPSVYKAESLPTVIIEALYCGLPVISTRIGEVSEMLKGNEAGELAGILIEQDDQTIIDDLVEAMSLYVHDIGVWQYHASLTRHAFEKFNMKSCAKRYINLYEAHLVSDIG